MLAERIESWADGWMKEGLQKGVHQGEASALQRLLTKRFGPLSSGVLAQITCATPAQIESWLDAVLDAPSLEAIFGPTQH